MCGFIQAKEAPLFSCLCPISCIGKMKPCFEEKWNKPVVLHSAHCPCGPRPVHLVCWCECRKNQSPTTQCRCGMKRVTVLCAIHIFCCCSRNGSGDTLSSFLSISQYNKTRSVVHDPAGLTPQVLPSVILLTIFPSLGVPLRHMVTTSPSLSVSFHAKSF